ncbi:MAG: hypothetical protein Q9181_003645 [Wetmoreana brouardii]
MSPSTNRDNRNQLPLGPAAATITTTTSPAVSAEEHIPQHASPSLTSNPPPKPLQRTPSSTSISTSESSVTPALHKRASYTSLQGSKTGATPPRSPAIRRVSSNLSLSQPLMGPRSSLPAPAEEPERPSVTAASVARDYFVRELEVHQEGSGADHSHKTVVILQDDCYGHRYSRPRTSRASLGTIVERPERIHASVLGLATAYVRVGGRHAGSHSGPHPKRKVGLLSSMPFRIQKTDRRVSLTSQSAASVHGARWMADLKTMCEAAESKLAMTGKELARPQSSEQGTDKSNADRSKLHEGDLYLCSGSLDALEGAIGGVCEAVDAVFKESGPRRAFVCIRPPGHHCSADMPSGFCWVNNVHIGINYATKTHDLTHAAIIDFDLHHGDGSQSIAWAHNARVASMPKNTPQSKRTAIGYFSLHDINSYPCEGGNDDKVRNASLCLENAHGQTIWNVHLQPWKTEQEFWDMYQHRYSTTLSKARSFLRQHSERLRQAPLHPRPKAAIFLSAGFDASEWESPGMQRHQVNVPTDFYARFTRDVVAIAEEEGLGVDGRVISVLEGGYSDRALMSGVLSHLSGLTASETPLPPPLATSNGLGHEMSQRLGKLEINGHTRQGSGNVLHPNEPPDSDWWALPSLEEIEKLVNPPAPTAAPKKVRGAVPTSYTSATQSYTAKIVSPPQNRRSVSSSAATCQSSTTSSPRAPSPPPPPVDWTIAAHELSKLLVPSDRQTLSCKPEDLNAEATRARRDRQSNIGLPVEVPAIDGKRMQLRDRKAKPPKYASEEEGDTPLPRANRRKTIADVTTLPQEEDAMPPVSAQAGAKKVAKPKARRSSMASTVSSVNGDKPSRPSFGSSDAVPPTQTSVFVKKSRALSSSRAEAAKPRLSKPKPPIPPVPTAYSAAAKRISDADSPNNASEPLAVNEDIKNQDVDQLASGMNKMSIKLNVPSREEQKNREAKRGQAAPRGRPKSTTTKASQVAGVKQKPLKAPNPTAKTPVGPTNNDGEAPAQDTISSLEVSRDPVSNTEPRDVTALPKDHSQSNPQQDLTSSPTHSDVAPPSLLPPTAPAVAATAPVMDGSSMLPPGLPQYHLAPSPQPPIDPSNVPLPPSLPPQLLPVAATLPATPKHAKRDLPIFTSTSPIVFGKPSTSSQGIDQVVAARSDGQNQVLRHPETGERTHVVPQEDPQPSSTQSKPAPRDIFDVPVTPQHPRSSGT